MKKKTQPWQVLTLAAVMGAGSAGSAFAYPEFELRGRAHIDAAFHDEDETVMGDSINTRRVRLGASGNIDPDWDFMIEYDFSEGGVSAQAVSLGRTLPLGRLIIGQAKVPMGLNQLTSGNNMTFIERSSISNLVPDSFRLGLGYQLAAGHSLLQTMVYSRAIGEDTDEGDSQIGSGARFVYTPINSNSEVLHLGVSFAYEDRADQNSLRFRDRPEARPAGVRLIDTGEDTIEDVKDTFKYGLEAAYRNGPFSLEAEYLNADVNRRDNSNPSFDGYHIQASYVLTGESRSYSGGTFGGITPAGVGGAWEVAARFSQADLTDGGVSGGKQENITLGLNYYVNANIRFMGNLIRSDITDGINGDETVNIALFRAQYSF